eukprot:4652994-Heterocapsa_arctica.AAC.1
MDARVPSCEPSSPSEVLLVLAGRIGRAYRSARRDMWRLHAMDEYPEIFSVTAKALQLCGSEL